MKKNNAGESFSRILATDFGIWPLFKGLDTVSDKMNLSKQHWKALANYLCLYDQIVIPTGNLQIIPVLRTMLGDDILDELIKNNIITLARYKKWFFYTGNGEGLRFLQINKVPSDRNNIFESYFTPLDEAIDTIMRVSRPASSHKRTNQFSNLLLDKIVPIADKLDISSFKEEVYKDILGSPYLRNFFSLRNSGANLDRLKGINPNQITLYSPHVKITHRKDIEIQSLLQVGFENFLLNIGAEINATGIASDENTLTIIKAKGQRFGSSLEGSNAFTKIQEISGIPDLGDAFAEKRISPEQILDIRESKHAQNFRNWFSSVEKNSTSSDIAIKYVESIGKTGLLDKIPLRMIRFALTTGLGILEPISGTVASAIDSLLLNKALPNKSPQLFMMQAKTILMKDKSDASKIQQPKMSGRDRNRLCSCGSNKKFKHCCGK